MSSAVTTPVLRKTALNSTHRQLGAKMVDFGGWDMPVEYSGLTAEHLAIRTGVGVFDVSHMGDIQLRGPSSLAAVQHISMNDASKLAVGQAHYSALLYPQGTFVDDVIVHKLSENDYLLVINAGTREKDVQWVRSQIGAMPGVHVSDYSDYYTQLAIQGPRAAETMAEAHQCRLGDNQELLVRLGHSMRLAEYADRSHRLYRRRRIRDICALGRADQRSRVERSA